MEKALKKHLTHFLLEVGKGNLAVVNTFLDSLLEDLRNNPQFREQIDPMVLDNFGDGPYQVTNAEIRGLSSLNRNGQCTLSMTTSKFKLLAPLLIKNVSVSGKYQYLSSPVNIRGSIEGKIEVVRMVLMLSGPLKGGKASMDSFQVKEFTGVNITKITGLSVAFNWLLKLIINKVVEQSKETIKENLEEEASAFLEKKISEVEFPSLSLVDRG